MPPKASTKRSKADSRPKQRPRASFGRQLASARSAGSDASGVVKTYTPPPDPRPIPNVGEQFVRREFQAAVSATAGSTADQSILLSDILDSSVTDPKELVVESIELWSPLTLSITGIFPTTTLTTYDGSDVISTDYASVAECARVGFRVDPAHAQAVTASTTVLCKYRVDRNKLTGVNISTTDPAPVVAHVKCWTLV